MIGWIISICGGLGVLITAFAITYVMIKYDTSVEYILFFMLVISALVLALDIHQHFFE